MEKVLYNTDEHAEIHEFWIDDRRYKGAIILDEGGAMDRSKKSTDHAQGVYKVTATLSAPLSLLQVVPKKGLMLELDKKKYTIVQVKEVVGEVVLTLEMRSG